MTATPSTAFGALESSEAMSSEEVDDRARGLLEQLTLPEKVKLMSGDPPFWAGIADMFAPGGYNSRAWVAGEVPRLGIPGIRFLDGPVA